MPRDLLGSLLTEVSRAGFGFRHLTPRAQVDPRSAPRPSLPRFSGPHALRACLLVLACLLAPFCNLHAHVRHDGIPSKRKFRDNQIMRVKPVDVCVEGRDGVYKCCPTSAVQVLR